MCRFPAPGCTDPHCGGAEPTIARAEREREKDWGGGSQRGRPGPAPESPPRPQLREPAPAAPRPLRGPAARLSPGPAGRARSPAFDDPLPGPRQLNLQRTAGSDGARPPRAGPLSFPGYSPTERGRCEGAGRRRPRSSATLSATRSPDSEPTEPRRLCLPGLSPARSLDKHFRGNRGGQGFGTGTAPGLELPGLPGGAEPLNPAPASGLLANPCGPAVPGRRLVPLILTDIRIVPLQPPNSMEARRIQPSPVRSPCWPTVPWCFPHLLLSRLKTQ